MLVFWIYTCAAWLDIKTVGGSEDKTYSAGGSPNCAGACTVAAATSDVKTLIGGDSDFAAYPANQKHCQRFMAAQDIKPAAINPTTHLGTVQIDKGSYIDPEHIDDLLTDSASASSTDEKAAVTLFWTATIPWEFEVETTDGTKSETGHKYDASKGEKIGDICGVIANYLSTKKYTSDKFNNNDKKPPVCKMYTDGGPRGHGTGTDYDANQTDAIWGTGMGGNQKAVGTAIEDDAFVGTSMKVHILCKNEVTGTWDANPVS